LALDYSLIKRRQKLGICFGRLRLIALGVFLSFTHPFFVMADDHGGKFNEAVQAVRDRNYSAAYEGFLALAEEADHDAQYNLATLLRRGLGHPVNYAQSLKWAWLADLGGNTKATKLCEELVGLIPEDTLATIRLQVKQALDGRFEKGDNEVILQLAQFHLSIVTEPDYKAAYALRALAAAIGIRNALDLRDGIEGELEPADLIEAQRMAATLFAEKNWVIQDAE